MMSFMDEIIPRAAVSHDHVVRTEVAMEIVNRARTLVYARIYSLKGPDGDAEAADRLRERAHQLHDLLRSLHYRQQEHVEAVIERWGPLVSDEALFWQVLQDERSLLAA